jgi:hypothetical protein
MVVTDGTRIHDRKVKNNFLVVVHTRDNVPFSKGSRTSQHLWVEINGSTLLPVTKPSSHGQVNHSILKANRNWGTRESKVFGAIAVLG